MSYIIAIRLPKDKGGKLVILTDDIDEGTAAEYPNKFLANQAAKDNLLCEAYGYELIYTDC